MPKKEGSEIARIGIDIKTICQLWGISAGRCEMCNQLLYIDPMFGTTGNFAQNAHVHAVSTNGPRHKEDMTQGEINNVANLMLLCPQHHKMIDDNPDEFKDGLLLQIKTEHEDRICEITAICKDQETRMVSFIAPIDTVCPEHDTGLFRQAVLNSGMYPRQTGVISLNPSFVPYQPTKEYYLQKSIELEQAFLEKSKIISEGESISLFALGLQPLLIKLGTFINDQYNTKVFQCHREGHKWAWKTPIESIEFITTKKLINNNDDEVALIIDLSASVADDRITSAINKDITTFHITINSPNRNFVRCPEIQDDFVKAFRNVMEEIKNLRPKARRILLFPVMPNSLAVKLGMDYMAKTDLPMTIFDEDKINAGFFETITIGERVNV
jgi:hypothetical protein